MENWRLWCSPCRKSVLYCTCLGIALHCLFERRAAVLSVNKGDFSIPVRCKLLLHILDLITPSPAKTRFLTQLCEVYHIKCVSLRRHGIISLAAQSGLALCRWPPWLSARTSLRFARSAVQVRIEATMPARKLSRRSP